jgi:hypothetical protein
MIDWALALKALVLGRIEAGSKTEGSMSRKAEDAMAAGADRYQVVDRLSQKEIEAVMKVVVGPR